MKPVNNKSLFATQCKWIEKVENEDSITFFQKAQLVVGLSRTAVSCLIHEATRAKILSNPDIEKKFRNIELKDFDSTPE